MNTGKSILFKTGRIIVVDSTQQTQVSSLRQRRQEIIRKLAWVERKMAKVERRLEMLAGKSRRHAD